MSVFDRVREGLCGLQGHDNLLQFGRDRLYLKCIECGHESPGWDVSDTYPHKLAPVAASEDPAKRREEARPPLVQVRRIA